MTNRAYREAEKEAMKNAFRLLWSRKKSEPGRGVEEDIAASPPSAEADKS